MKTITLVPFGGLANRIYAVTSAIGFCRDNKTQLKIVWFKDYGMGAGFHQILKLSPDVENVEIIDAKWTDYRYDRPGKKNLWLPRIWQIFAFDRRFYDKECQKIKYEEYKDLFSPYDSIYLNSCSLFYEWTGMFCCISPAEAVSERIRKQTKLFMPQKTVGLHIRRGDLTKYSEEKTPLSLFIGAMKKELETDRETKFYIASDSQEEKRKLKDLFGDAAITSFKEVRRDTVDGIMEASAELYILSCTKKIYGTYYSTYSTLAAQLTNIPVEILSVEK